jgi:hypothetical protein
MSGPAAEAEASMVSLRGAIQSTHAALEAFQASSTKASAGLAAITAKGQQARALAEAKGSAQLAAINAKGQQALALAEAKAGSGLMAAREKMAAADMAQKNKAIAALILSQSKASTALSKATKPEKAKAAAMDKPEKVKSDKLAAAKAKLAPKSEGDPKAGKISEGLKSIVGGAGKAMAALSAIAIGLAAAGLKMGFPLAMGYKGMAKLQMISARMSLDIRKLFSGVDPAPVIRAAEKFATMFSKTTSTGRVLSDIIGRVFNGLFGFLEAAQPYVTAFAQGMIFGFLTVENAVLKARIGLLPFTNELESMVGKGQLLKVAFYGGALVFGLLAVAATAAVAPFLLLGAAIEKVIGLYNEWTGNTVTLKKVPKGATAGALPDAGKAATPATAATGLAGQAAGAAMGDGLVKGITDKMGAATAAGAALAKAADTGVKTQAAIKSPSRVFRRAGGYMGEGVALGLKDSEDSVQKAAANSLVPDLDKAPKGSAKAGKAGGDGGGVTINFNGPVGGAVADFEAAVHRAFTNELADIAMNLGVKV